MFETIKRLCSVPSKRFTALHKRALIAVGVLDLLIHTALLIATEMSYYHAWDSLLLFSCFGPDGELYCEKEVVTATLLYFRILSIFWIVVGIIRLIQSCDCFDIKGLIPNVLISFPGLILEIVGFIILHHRRQDYMFELHRINISGLYQEKWMIIPFIISQNWWIMVGIFATHWAFELFLANVSFKQRSKEIKKGQELEAGKNLRDIFDHLKDEGGEKARRNRDARKKLGGKKWESEDNLVTATLRRSAEV